MSAYVLGDENLDAILAGCQAHFKSLNLITGKIASMLKSEQDLSEVGQILKGQNYRSVNVRYNESEAVAPYKFKGLTQLYSPVQLLKILDCYEYQSCETDDYKETEACAIINRIRKNLIAVLPGYDEAKWGI